MNRKNLYVHLLSMVLVVSPFGAQAADSAVTKIDVRVGSAQGGIKELATVDAKNLVLTPTRSGKLKAIFNFSATGLDSSVSLSGQSTLEKSSNKFTVQIKKKSGSWSKIGQISSNGMINAAISGNISSYISNQQISIRISSDGKVGILKIDKLSLAGKTTTPPVVVPPVIPPVIPPVVVPPTQPPAAVGALKPGSTWYWQLSGAVNMNVNTQVYDIDLYDNSAASFAALKNSGKKVICYFSAGTYEDWRDDAKDFPAAAKGSKVDGWPGENWLDVRNATVRTIMSKRLDEAKAKGCDGVEPDNVDGYANGNGVGLTKANQIDYNKFLAAEAHKRGLSIALKNSTDLVASLVSDFDFAVVEECYQYSECDAYLPFVQQNKAVFIAEYKTLSTKTCAEAKADKFSLAYYNLELNGKKFDPCP